MQAETFQHSIWINNEYPHHKAIFPWDLLANLFAGDRHTHVNDNVNFIETGGNSQWCPNSNNTKFLELQQKEMLLISGMFLEK